jgi:putative SOS response-associated peptidase YedK
MPVILLREGWRRWLGEEEVGADELLALLLPYPAELLRAYGGRRLTAIRPARRDPGIWLSPLQSHYHP